MFASWETPTNARYVVRERAEFEVEPELRAEPVDCEPKPVRVGSTSDAEAIALPPLPGQRENTVPSTPAPQEVTIPTRPNGTALHDSAQLSSDSGVGHKDELGNVLDARAVRGTLEARERDFLQAPANRHQIPIRIGPTSHNAGVATFGRGKAQ